MRVASLYSTSRPVFSLEFFTPKTDKGRLSLLRTAERLKAINPAFASITCGAAGSTRQRTADLAIEVQRALDITVMPHLVCTGTTQDELANTLTFMKEHGIENVLALRGDPPRGDVAWTPVKNGFRYASELTQFVRDSYSIGVGGACYPEKHHEASSLEADIDHLKRKVDSGAEFLLTQLFFDNEVFFRFVDRVRAVGIDVPIVPGIMPILSLANLERIATLSPGTNVPTQLRDNLRKADNNPADSLAVGVDFAAEQCASLLQKGAPGIHFYTLNKSKATLLTHARL